MNTDRKKEHSQKERTRNEKEPATERDPVVDDQPVCNKAPEWAEHQRFWQDDEPCDDGRSGRLEK